MSLEDLIRGIGPVPPEVKEAYKNTEFSCPGCNGMIIPQSMTEGICLSCKDRVLLENCEYEIDEE